MVLVFTDDEVRRFYRSQHRDNWMSLLNSVSATEFPQAGERMTQSIYSQQNEPTMRLDRANSRPSVSIATSLSRRWSSRCLRC